MSDLRAEIVALRDSWLRNSCLKLPRLGALYVAAQGAHCADAAALDAILARHPESAALASMSTSGVREKVRDVVHALCSAVEDAPGDSVIDVGMWTDRLMAVIAEAGEGKP